MTLLAAEHVVALLATAIVSALAVWAGRRRPGRWLRPAARGLAALIVAAALIEQAVAVARGTWSLAVYLPLHLSDVVTVVAALALWSLQPLLVELTYFWGLTASLQAVITPDLTSGYPDITYFTFFVTHSGVVAGALLLVGGLGIAPRPGAVRRAFVATLAVAGVAAVANVATGGNYMFLREKPDGSLLDLFGPWPLYIAVAAILALALFAALDAPFRTGRSAPDQNAVASASG